MTIYQTAFAKGTRIMPEPDGSEVMSVRMEFSLTAALAATDVVEFGFLPQNCVPIDWMIDNDDLDSGATITTDFGILTAAGTAVSAATADGGAKWLTASAQLQAPLATSLLRPLTNAHLRVVPDAVTKRKIGMVIIAGPSTAVTGLIGVTLMYRGAYLGQ